MKRKWVLLIPILILIIVGSLLIKYSPYPYSSLIRPSFAPPSYVFSIAWTLFYCIIYISATKSITSGLKNNILFQLYLLICFTHLLWILFFFTFGYHLIALFLLIVIYLLSVSFIFYMSKKQKKQALFNIPYLIWLLYALLLNLSFLILN